MLIHSIFDMLNMLFDDCYEVRILQSHIAITFIQSQGHKDFKNQNLL